MATFGRHDPSQALGAKLFDQLLQLYPLAKQELYIDPYTGRWIVDRLKLDRQLLSDHLVLASAEVPEMEGVEEEEPVEEPIIEHPWKKARTEAQSAPPARTPQPPSTPPPVSARTAGMAAPWHTAASNRAAATASKPVGVKTTASVLKRAATPPPRTAASTAAKPALTTAGKTRPGSTTTAEKKPWNNTAAAGGARFSAAATGAAQKKRRMPEQQESLDDEDIYAEPGRATSEPGDLVARLLTFS
eukprot:TRINITY_DN36356_c0_g1_i1.p1 TRINITY_DN36356_c0_g1~~TRINITY_DN36356_c0_g1_i1.p1  ORF type:complete len:245 (-),score=38.74 TRINITY_DN36356_c0_g1_i1:263-997(-)